MDSSDTAVEETEQPLGVPDIKISVNQVFGLDTELQAPAFSQTHELVPDVDEAYCFDRDTTLAILAGFAYNRRVMIQGYHGTGKSTHIDQAMVLCMGKWYDCDWHVQKHW